MNHRAREAQRNAISETRLMRPVSQTSQRLAKVDQCRRRQQSRTVASGVVSRLGSARPGSLGRCRRQGVRWSVPSSPSGCLKPSLQVLSSCDQKRLDVDVDESMQLESLEPMPRLRFGEQRFDPHAPLARRLREGRRVVVRSHAFQVLSIE